LIPQDKYNPLFNQMCDQAENQKILPSQSAEILTDGRNRYKLCKLEYVFFPQVQRHVF
jgi:hypothetical protein